MGRGNENEWGAQYADCLNRIMSADLAVIPELYDRAICGEYPGQTYARGWNEVDSFWIGLRSAFPSAQFSIDHQIGREDPMMPPRAAIRWSLHGRHEGWGSFADQRALRFTSWACRMSNLVLLSVDTR